MSGRQLFGQAGSSELVVFDRVVPRIDQRQPVLPLKQFAVVAGEPGVGKTRLLEELRNLARVRKVRTLYGRFIEQDRSFSYQDPIPPPSLLPL